MQVLVVVSWLRRDTCCSALLSLLYCFADPWCTAVLTLTFPLPQDNMELLESELPDGIGNLVDIR
jgi:hypothetical protein